MCGLEPARSSRSPPSAAANRDPRTVSRSRMARPGPRTQPPPRVHHRHPRVRRHVAGAPWKARGHRPATTRFPGVRAAGAAPAGPPRAIPHARLAAGDAVSGEVASAADAAAELANHHRASLHGCGEHRHIGDEQLEHTSTRGTVRHGAAHRGMVFRTRNRAAAPDQVWTWPPSGRVAMRSLVRTRRLSNHPVSPCP